MWYAVATICGFFLGCVAIGEVARRQDSRRGDQLQELADNTLKIVTRLLSVEKRLSAIEQKQKY